jgi:hypothetical protein
MIVLVYNCATSDAIGRRQMCWVVFGLLVAFVPASIAFPMTVYDPQSIPWAFAAISAYAIVPFCLLLAIDRYNPSLRVGAATPSLARSHQNQPRPPRGSEFQAPFSVLGPITRRYVKQGCEAIRPHPGAISNPATCRGLA